MLMVIPPKEGMAIGTMTSEPRPVEVSTGISARMVVAVVIRQGLTRRSPASIVASRISFTDEGVLLEKICFR